MAWKKLIYDGDYDKGRRIILTPAGAIVPSSNGAEQKQTDGTNLSYYTLNFDNAADESAYWECIVPDDYDGGNIIPNIWYKTTTNVGNVSFDVAVLGREEGETFDNALGAAQTVNDNVPATANSIGICAPTNFNPGWAAGDFVAVKLLRDVSDDNAAADVSVVMVEIDY